MAAARSLAERTIQACLVVVALIHLAPSIGALGAGRLSSLYGIPIDGSDLTILMRHRAVLFGILGTLLMVGAFQASLRTTALVAGLASVVSFLGLALGNGQYNSWLGAVVAIDMVALVLLVLATALHLRQRRTATK